MLYFCKGPKPDIKSSGAKFVLLPESEWSSIINFLHSVIWLKKLYFEYAFLPVRKITLEENIKFTPNLLYRNIFTENRSSSEMENTGPTFLFHPPTKVNVLTENDSCIDVRFTVNSG